MILQQCDPESIRGRYSTNRNSVCCVISVVNLLDATALAAATRANVPAEPILSLNVVHQMNPIHTIAMEKTRSRRFRKSAGPKPVCPGCRMVKNDWPGEGYTHDGQTYCCQGCAEGTGCICVAVGKPGFSRQGQKVTRAEPRPGEQRSGAPEPQGELSGERDNFGTEEALDQGG
jgi:hypothetical protein